MKRSLLLGIILLIYCLGAAAQTATGILQGRVTDASGAAVPEAKVTIENQNTGVRQQTVTNAEGLFVQPFLSPGDYRLSVEKAGFQQYATPGIRIAVQQTVDMVIPLKVGEVSTTVEVSANAAQLATTTSTVSTVITNKAMLDLPLNGRNPFALATLVPGVIPGGGSTPWLSGGRNASSEITIDGASVIVPENNVSIQDTGYQPIVDTVEEFAVITNSVAAEFGRTGGGVITVATKSGTNSLHGSLFEFLRNSKLDANSWSNNRNGVKKSSFQRNQFGFTVGGPVYIPGLYNGKNRTFFFVAEQSQRQRNAASGSSTIPLDTWQNGDFSSYKNGSGNPITIYDPETVAQDAKGNWVRTPFAGNIIPSARFNPIAVKLLSFYPTPNAVPTNQYTNASNYFVSGKAPSTENRLDSRLDHNLTDRWKIWGRGSFSTFSSENFNGWGNIASSSGSGISYGQNYNVAVNSVYTLSPTTILNVNYGFARKVSIRVPFSQGFDQTTIGMPAAVAAAAAEQNLEFPRFDIGGNNGVSSIGQGNWTTLFIQAYSHDTHADLTKVMAKHTIKFGANYRQLFMNFRQHGQPAGSYSFSNAWTQKQVGAATSSTQGSGLASFLLGQLGGGSLQHTFAAATTSAYYGFYVQDDWKASRKLTLNLGLRWDVDVPHTERYNRLSYFDISQQNPLMGQVPGLAGRDMYGVMNFVTPDHRRQVPTDLNNWGPRFGFAYQINDKTVFRGAYSILYSPSVLQASGTSGSSGTEGFQQSTSVQTSYDGGIHPAATLSNPFPTGFNRPIGAAGGELTNTGFGIGESFFNDWVNPIVQEWNATLQRDLGAGFIVELGYLANKGNHLNDGESSMAYNQLPASYFSLGSKLLGTNQVANPFYGIITNPTSSLSRPTVSYSQLLKPYPQYTGLSAFRKPQGNSIYHAFTLSVTKRYSQGLNLQLSYTAGKLIDDNSQTVTFLGAAGTKQDFYCRPCERSISAQDVSQRLVISANYELPFGRGRHFMTSAPAVLDYVLGGWQINGIATFQTATPMQISNGGNNTQLGSPGQRPNNNGTSAKKTGPIEDRLTSYFDQSVFSQAGNFTFGNTSRTSPDLRGPGTRAFDGSIFKRFRVHENVQTEFRVEAFNFFNHPTWNGPGTTVTSPGSFGIITSKGGNRNLQLALKLQF